MKLALNGRSRVFGSASAVSLAIPTAFLRNSVTQIVTQPGAECMEQVKLTEGRSWRNMQRHIAPQNS